MSNPQPGPNVEAATTGAAKRPPHWRIAAVWSEFRQFAVRGNVVDLAVAIVVGAAFGRITTSLVNDVIMPPIGLLLGKVDFSNLYLNLTGKPYVTLAAARAAGAPVIAYGAFVNTVLEFLIVAFAMFVVVRGINRLKSRQPAAAAGEPTTKTCPYCLTVIPLKATRCAACTADLPAEDGAASEVAGPAKVAAASEGAGAA